LQQLLNAKDFIHVILSNTGTDDTENQPARQALHEAGIDITDRMVGSGHIGHNKFVVYLDGNKQPKAVWTGSTNWTETGLCTQSNNGILIESSALAKIYLDEWNLLKEDDSAQGADFRTHNNKDNELKADSANTDISLWFSPNTKQKSKPSGDKAATPSDMAAVFEAMENAKHSILFLVFQPGSPSIVDEAGKLQSSNSGLFIHGAATDPKAVKDFNTYLFHRTGEETDADVVAAAAINDQFGFWEKELLKSGQSAHAIIHDKIVVIDTFSDDCVVITGSHNLGYRASYNNDENLLIIRGNKALAAAYTAHVLDVYDHYRWRFLMQQKGNAAWTGLSTSDTWQDKYFSGDPNIENEQNFWFPSNGSGSCSLSSKPKSRPAPAQAKPKKNPNAKGGRRGRRGKS
jgi:phosphatidylserine/phosphatidylglycerophosphate/cardiolipin synthase-like enzyme